MTRSDHCSQDRKRYISEKQKGMGTRIHERLFVQMSGARATYHARMTKPSLRVCAGPRDKP
eukprot:2142561-Karenia_brevis.AAC.1